MSENSRKAYEKVCEKVCENNPHLPDDAGELGLAGERAAGLALQLGVAQQLLAQRSHDLRQGTRRVRRREQRALDTDERSSKRHCERAQRARAGAVGGAAGLEPGRCERGGLTELRMAMQTPTQADSAPIDSAR